MVGGDDEDIERDSELNKFDKLPDPRGSNQKSEMKLTALLMFGICFSYMCVSQVLTIVNKFIYATYGFKSPLNLLFLQCICNLVISTNLMVYKQYFNPQAFENLHKYGIVIGNFNTVITDVKAKVGC